MNIKQFITLAFAATAFVTHSVQAQAHNCGEVSPLMSSLGEQYTQLTYSSIDSMDANELNTTDLIDLIDPSKMRTGHGIRVECFGDLGRWEEDLTTFTLTDLEHRLNNKGSLILSAFEESETDLKRKVIELPTKQNWQAISDDKYKTSYLFRLQSFTTDGSRAAEIELTIQNSQEAISVTEVLYINGLKVDWVTWELDS